MKVVIGPRATQRRDAGSEYSCLPLQKSMKNTVICSDGVSFSSNKQCTKDAISLDNEVVVSGLQIATKTVTSDVIIKHVVPFNLHVLLHLLLCWRNKMR